MRKILLLFVFLLSFNGYSQETEEVVTTEEEIIYAGKDELKVNALYLLLGFPEISYERILNEESALGISVAFSIEEVFGIDFMAVPYYRVYFGDKPAAGFFVEGNAAFYVGDYYEYSNYDEEGYRYEETMTNEVGAGIGLAVGAKFMTESGWVFEVFGGAGRNFLNKNELDAVYPRMGLTVGRRF